MSNFFVILVLGVIISTMKPLRLSEARGISGSSTTTTSKPSDNWSSIENLQGAEDGFIVRPLFQYRQERLKRRNGLRRYGNRAAYSLNPIYPRFFAGY